jgi:hypothetical protein
MENTFAGNRISGFLVPRALAVPHADNRLSELCNGRPKNFAEVEATAFAQRTGAVKVKHGLCGLRVCPIENTLSPGDNFAIEIKKTHLKGF